MPPQPLHVKLRGPWSSWVASTKNRHSITVLTSFVEGCRPHNKASWKTLISNKLIVLLSASESIQNVCCLQEKEKEKGNGHLWSTCYAAGSLRQPLIDGARHILWTGLKPRGQVRRNLRVEWGGQANSPGTSATRWLVQGFLVGGLLKLSLEGKHRQQELWGWEEEGYSWLWD